MSKTTKEEQYERARSAFEAWAKAQQGMGLTVWESETPTSRPINVPFDWDDLDADQQEVWVDATAALSQQLDQARAANEALRETITDSHWALGERLGLGAEDDAPTTDQLLERLQQLLTELQNSVPRAELEKAKRDHANSTCGVNQ